MTTEAVAALVSVVGDYRGSGTNHEGDAFDAFVRIESVGGGTGVSIAFQAIGSDGEVFHDERAIVAANTLGGTTYYPISNNIAVVVPHVQVASDEAGSLVFETGDMATRDGFRERITIALQDTAIEYRYAWGLPGGEFADRSAVRLQRT